MTDKELIKVVTRERGGWYVEENLECKKLPIARQVRDNEIDILYFSDGSADVNCPYASPENNFQYCVPAINLHKQLSFGNVENQKLLSCPWARA